MADLKVLILRESGTNCEEETANAFRILGASVSIIHMNILRKRRESIEDYQILVIPGGFSHGDAISAAVIWANELRYRLKKDLVKFIEQGKLVLGICNGFQVLVKAGLLPAFEETIEPQSVTLAFNNIGMYFDTWVYLKPNPAAICPLTQGIDRLLNLPVAHAEGRFTTDERTLSRLMDKNQIIFRYVDPEGKSAGFPWNPNGSLADIAGICNPCGNVLGLMPHPERYIHWYMHPLWTSRRSRKEIADGLLLFKNAVDYAKRKLI